MIHRKKCKFLLFLAAVLAGTTVLTGCGSLLKIGFDEEDYIDKRIKAIIEAADEDDADQLMELFCENVRTGNAELREEAESFVNAVDGEYVSGEGLGYTESDSSDRDSYYKEELTGGYLVETTSGKYVIDFDDVAQTYSGKEQYQGLLSLGVQSYEDYENEACMANGFLGIYVVTPDNHGLIRLMRTADRPELLEERLAEAIGRFGLTEEEYENLTAAQQDHLLRAEEIFLTLEDRYDQEFCSPQDFTPDMLEEAVDQLIMYPEGGDPETDCFTAYWNEENDRFFDNYQDVIIQNLMGEMIAEQLSSDGTAAAVKVIAEIQDTDFVSDKTDITESDIAGNVTADCTVFIEETGLVGTAEERAQISDSVQSWFSDQQIPGNHHLVFLSEEEFAAVDTQSAAELPESSILYREDFTTGE